MNKVKTIFPPWAASKRLSGAIFPKGGVSVLCGQATCIRSRGMHAAFGLQRTFCYSQLLERSFLGLRIAPLFKAVEQRKDLSLICTRNGTWNLPVLWVGRFSEGVQESLLFL